jgi:hypothetical protein
MPRAGSGWYYNLTNELMLAAGRQDARRIRQRYHLQSILTEVNCNIGALTPRRLLAVLVPSLLGNTFVIKAHAAPTPLAVRLIQWGKIRPAYIYRDPRDAMLSAYENGQKAIQKGRPNAFSHLTSFEAALDFILEYTRIWQAWMAVDQALHTRFEDMLESYQPEAERLAAFLGLEIEDSIIRGVLNKFRPAVAANPEQKGIHFSQGKTGRFRQKMSPQEQAILAERLGPYLKKMGYPV